MGSTCSSCSRVSNRVNGNLIMAHLAPVHWKKFEKFLLYAGCHLVRTKGDHRIYWRADLQRPVVIPQDKELPVFIIRNNLRILGIDVQEYLEILKRI